MPEDYGRLFLSEQLNDISDLSTIVGTSIYDAAIVPSTDKSKETVNYYPSGVYNAAVTLFQREWSVDCRHPDQTISINMGVLIVEKLNRIQAQSGSFTYSAVCRVLNTIDTVDIDGVYNTPVQVTLRRR